MQTEIEVKFLDVDFEKVRAKLNEAGAHLEQPMRLMRRSLIEEPHHAAVHGFIRIRDEGDKITMTYKQRDDVSAMHGTKEVEVVVSDFDATIKLFEAAGWPPVTYQESRRETWRLGDAEIVLDEWPWIPPYIEVEAPSEESVRKASEKLGFVWSEALVGSVDSIYHRDFPNMSIRGIIDIKEARFGDPVPPQFLGELVE